MATQREIESKIAKLEAVEVVVATNSGTYSAAEAARATGSGDPAHNDWVVYETVGGRRRSVGCQPDRAPGWSRYLGAAELRAKRAEVAALRSQLQRLRRVAGWSV
jgi:hypothetical protein